jgi:hypothetical protein
MWVRTDREKEFLDKPFQGMLKREGIPFQVCRNPDIKRSVVERVNRTLRDKLYKYFSYNMYKYKAISSQEWVVGFPPKVRL